MHMGGRERAAAPLLRCSSGEVVAERLRSQITTGELGPGQRLNQEDIAAQFDTSRVPVREHSSSWNRGLGEDGCNVIVWTNS